MLKYSLVIKYSYLDADSKMLFLKYYSLNTILTILILRF